MLDVIDVTHSYNGKQKALKNVSLKLQGTGVVGLLGANGAGKSTLMNIISGVLMPQSGRVLLNDFDLKGERLKALLQLGFLPQKPPLYPNMTVKEYLKFTAKLRDIPSKNIDRKVNDVIEKCGIKNYEHRLIKVLSGGYQQRVGIAQAIVHSPKIVILDEPTNGLDPHRIIEIRNLISHLASERLILLSTHILSEIEAISNRLLVMENGKIIANNQMEYFKSQITQQYYFLKTSEKIGEKILQENPLLKRYSYINENALEIEIEKNVSPYVCLELFISQGIKVEEFYKKQYSLEDIYKNITKQ